MALRAAACGMLTRRGAAAGGARALHAGASGASRASPSAVASVGAVPSPSVLHMERRAFMSTHELFAAPSFPLPSRGDADVSAQWMESYAKMDQASMWKIGSFPLQDAMQPMHAMREGVPSDEEQGVLAETEQLWDTTGMLSALTDQGPLRDGVSHGVDEILRAMDRLQDGYLADSVLKKRRKKMNKHKHRKRKKAQRMRTKKN